MLLLTCKINPEPLKGTVLKCLLSQVQSFDGNSAAFKESSIISDYFINHYEDD